VISLRTAMLRVPWLPMRERTYALWASWIDIPILKSCEKYGFRRCRYVVYYRPRYGNKKKYSEC